MGDETMAGIGAEPVRAKGLLFEQERSSELSLQSSGWKRQRDVSWVRREREREGKRWLREMMRMMRDEKEKMKIRRKRCDVRIRRKMRHGEKKNKTRFHDERNFQRKRERGKGLRRGFYDRLCGGWAIKRAKFLFIQFIIIKSHPSRDVTRRERVSKRKGLRLGRKKEGNKRNKYKKLRRLWRIFLEKSNKSRKTFSDTKRMHLFLSLLPCFASDIIPYNLFALLSAN